MHKAPIYLDAGQRLLKGEMLCTEGLFFADQFKDFRCVYTESGTIFGQPFARGCLCGGFRGYRRG